METLDLHGLFLCVLEGLLSWLLYIHNVGMVTLPLHGLFLYVPEGPPFELLYIHNAGIGTFDLHGLISCDTEACFSC